MTDKEKQFGARGGDALTFLVIVIVLLVTEVTLRVAEGALSGNIAHIKDIPQLAEDFDPSAPNSIAVIGNSLANNGIDLELIGRELSKQGLEIGDAEKLVPDATTIWSWLCILDNQILRNDHYPAVVVIPFAWNQLSDQSRILPTRLGAFFCTADDLRVIAKHTAVTSDIAGEFFFAKWFRTFAHRETIRNRVLSAIIPQYELLTQQINRQQRQHDDGSAHTLTYSALGTVLDKLTSGRTRLFVIAMPVRDNPYEIDAGLVDFASRSRLELLDYRALVAPSDSMFVDDMHLSPDGATILSEALVHDLSGFLRRPPYAQEH